MTFPWPDGYRAAASFTFDVDAESCVLAHDPSAASRMSLMSHQAYGPRVGVPRLLRVLRRQGVRATFFVPGFTADTYPDMVRAIVDDGHEVAHHGYLHEQTRGMDARTEARAIDRGLAALERLGIRPTGYRAPWWEMNWHTPRLLIERGFRYDSSLLDDDVPYRLREEQGKPGATLVEIPVHWGLDDWEQYAFYPGWTGSGVIESPRKACGMWREEAAAYHAEGGCYVLTSHPFLSGRPARSAALEGLIEAVRGMAGMWVTTLAEIAEHTERVVNEVRTVRRIDAPELSEDGERRLVG
ncbi:polysaccharide deacetylase family protein [Streptomyces ochraceiscleroticus]|uniref:Polysaccharide deacetylase n=1 Tax=Streptomyces ochraceiscleroticus TaxID=47761 RepID=A0ABW1MK71_9ACTN|nr:polysaccharide deacetylase [Streptomyces ochraceiscleroticus]